MEFLQNPMVIYDILLKNRFHRRLECLDNKKPTLRLQKQSIGF